jgi:uncharacterized protein (DUF58 family)
MPVQQVFMIAATAFMLAAAVFRNVPNLQFMAGVTVALPIVAYAACRLGLRGLECRRKAPQRVFEGSDFTVSLRVRNGGRMPKFFLRVSDALPEWFASDSYLSFAIPAAWPGKRLEFTYQARAEKRGVFAVGPASVQTSDPVGLFQAQKSLSERTELVVYPTPLPFDAQQRGGGHAFGTIETERPAVAGRGFEFATIREYRPGDEQKRIHWKSTARLGKLAVVEFEQSFARDVAICLDARAGTELGEGKKTTLEVAVKAAASLAGFAIRHGASASLDFSDAAGPHSVRASNRDEINAIYEALARVNADGAERIGAVLKRMAAQVNPGSLAMAATGDLDESLIEVAARWSARRVHLCVLLLDAQAFAGRPPGEDGVPAFAAALSRAGASVQILGPDDDLAAALRRIGYAAI